MPLFFSPASTLLVVVLAVETDRAIGTGCTDVRYRVPVNRLESRPYLMPVVLESLCSHLLSPLNGLTLDGCLVSLPLSLISDLIRELGSCMLCQLPGTACIGILMGLGLLCSPTPYFFPRGFVLLKSICLAVFTSKRGTGELHPCCRSHLSSLGRRHFFDRLTGFGKSDVLFVYHGGYR